MDSKRGGIVASLLAMAALTAAAYGFLGSRGDGSADDRAGTILGSRTAQGIGARPTATYLRASVNGVAPRFDFVQQWTSTLRSRGVARGDFNGDGRDDLAVVGTTNSEFSAPALVLVFLQQPDGSLGVPVQIDLPRLVINPAVNGIAAGDLNEDGRSDLVLMHAMVETGMLVMLSEPGGGFGWREDKWNDGFPGFAQPLLSDQDGDGHLDVIDAIEDANSSQQDPATGQLATWFGDGHGGFPRHAAVETQEHLPWLALGQLDGASRSDILSVSQSNTRPGTVRRADGAGGWLAPTYLPDHVDSYVQVPYYSSGTVLDVTGDGRDDAVISAAVDQPMLVVHAQLADGTLSTAATRFPGGGYASISLHADLDGNGLQDLLQVGPGPGGGAFYYILQDAYGPDYAVGHPFAGETPLNYAPDSATLGDFNGDGVPDLVVAAEGLGVVLYRGRLTPYGGPGGVPGAPQVVSALADPDVHNRAADVTLAAPASDGGAAVTGYSVYSIPSGGVDANAGEPGLVHRIVALENGKQYAFRARASNAAGKGAPSAPGGTVLVPATVVQLELYGDGVSEPDDADTTVAVRAAINAPAPPGGVSLVLSSQDGTAQAGSDYVALPPTLVTIPEGAYTSADVQLIVHGDLEIEGNETFQLQASNVQGAGAPAPLQMTIYDNDNVAPHLVLEGITVTEGDAGTSRAWLPLHLTKALPTDRTATIEAITFGNAEAGSDFSLPVHTVLIPAGQTLVQVPVDIVGDLRYEHVEAAHLFATLELAPPYQDVSFAVVVIEDNDPAPTMSVSDVVVQEGDDGAAPVMHFTATLSGVQPDDAWFSAETVSGTATAGLDFQDRHLSGLRIRAGQTQLDIPVTVLGDTRAEANEQFALKLGSPFNVLLADDVGTGTIVDDDPATGITVLGVTRPEGNGPGMARFLVQLGAPRAGPVSFDLRTSDGTAFAGSDYTAVVMLGAVIPAGQTQLAVDVPVLGDSITEDDETFVLGLSNVSGATPVRTQALARLVNDDLPAISVAGASAPEGTGGYPARFSMPVEVTLSAPSSKPVTYQLRIGRTGTATPGLDMDYLYAPMTIDAGRTRQVVDIGVQGDSDPEADETFSIEISSIYGATIADGSATGTIINDDGPVPAPAVQAGLSSKARVAARGRIRAK